MINRIEYSITDKCNLNCAYCSHYASLCEQNYTARKEVFERDIMRLAELTNFGRYLGTIGILGGEPLLHSQWLELCTIARKHLPYSRVRVVTNGTLIPSLTGQQLSILRRFDIEILISKYTKSINYDKIAKILDEYHIVWKFTQNGEYTNFAKYVMDESGSQSAKEMWKLCKLHQGTYTCHELRNGVLFPCSQIVRNQVLNRNFDTHFNANGSGIDIYCSTLEEIEEFLSKPVPFCKYCKVKEWNNRQGEYRPSTKSKDEFI